MNPELKEKWLKALRSGEYMQGIGALRDVNDQYCCLGVLADVIGCEWKPARVSFSLYACSFQNKPSEQYLRHDILPGHVQGEPARMNDEGATFTEIATYIQENL